MVEKNDRNCVEKFLGFFVSFLLLLFSSLSPNLSKEYKHTQNCKIRVAILALIHADTLASKIMAKDSAKTNRIWKAEKGFLLKNSLILKAWMDPWFGVSDLF